MSTRGAIDLSFRADLSNLTKQLAKMPETTEKEAKAMVKALEKQFKSAEKAAERAAKASGKAWQRSGRGARGAAADVGVFSNSLKQTTEVTGEADSAIKGFGSAVGLVSPQAEKAFFVVGELAGSVEGLSRLLTAGLGPLAMVTAAAAAAGGAYFMLSQDIKEAEERVSAAREELNKTVAMFGRLDEAMASAQFDLLAAQGKKSAEEIAKHNAEMKAAALVSADMAKATEDLEAAQKALREGTKDYTADISGMTAAQANVNYHNNEYNKKHGPALQAAVTRAQNTITALTKTQEEYAATLEKTELQRNANNEAQKRSTKSINRGKDAIEELIEATNRLIPDDRSKVQILADQYAKLQEESQKSATASERLAPAMASVRDAIDKINLDEYNEKLTKTQEEERKVTEELQKMGQQFGNVQGPIEKGEQLLAELNAEASKSDQHFQQLKPTIDAVSDSLENLQTQKANEKLSETASRISNVSSRLGQAFENIAALNLQQVTKEGRKALEVFDKRADHLDGTLADINDRISETTDDATKKQLEAEKELIEGRIEANEEAKKKEEELQNEQIKKAFHMQQAAQIASTIMATATAIMQAWAVPYAAATAPAMTAAIAALSATQVALISAQEPPTLHMGGMIRPDEQMVKARIGEGRLTAQGVNAIGGEAGLNAANAGGNMPTRIVVQQIYKHKVLDTVLSDSISRGGPIGSALNKRTPRGRRNPHRRAS